MQPLPEHEQDDDEFIHARIVADEVQRFGMTWKAFQFFSSLINSAITRSLRLGRNFDRGSSAEPSKERMSMRVFCGETLVAEIS